MEQGDLTSLHPLGDLPHPIIAKAVSAFGDDGSDDNFVGPITSSGNLPLLEIKTGQWRGGVWRDPETGVPWLVVAGLAKGDHQDRDDFYETVAREDASGHSNRWKPTKEDVRLLKRETAAKLVTDWELCVQQQVWKALDSVQSGGSIRIEVEHPLRGQGRLAEIQLEIVLVRESEYQSDEIVVEFIADTHQGSNLLWQLTTRVLITLDPPEHAWDRSGDTYSNIAEVGAWQDRVEELDVFVSQGQLAQSEPGRHSHYAHRQHIAHYTVEGLAVRAACGIFFVPTQDHEGMPVCPACSEHMEALRK